MLPQAAPAPAPAPASYGGASSTYGAPPLSSSYGSAPPSSSYGAPPSNPNSYSGRAPLSYPPAAPTPPHQQQQPPRGYGDYQKPPPSGVQAGYGPLRHQAQVPPPPQAGGAQIAPDQAQVSLKFGRRG